MRRLVNVLVEMFPSHPLRYIVNPDNKLTLRAQREIKEGEEVTIQYISFLFGNSKRYL